MNVVTNDISFIDVLNMCFRSTNDGPNDEQLRPCLQIINWKFYNKIILCFLGDGYTNLHLFENLFLSMN